mmetsp:Transcript_59478/g.69524  ORF Transcript_59478/g.69524 Transcript_59478/m.69524 type:complete len:128 (+) Transcript_59478:242-625(+)
MPHKNGIGTQRFKRVGDHTSSSFCGKPLSPVLLNKVKSHIEGAGIVRPGSKPTAPHKAVTLVSEDWPVLDTVLRPVLALFREPSDDLRFIKWAADELGHFVIAPQSTGQGLVDVLPPIEAETCRWLW